MELPEHITKHFMNCYRKNVRKKPKLHKGTHLNWNCSCSYYTNFYCLLVAHCEDWHSPRPEIFQCTLSRGLVVQEQVLLMSYVNTVLDRRYHFRPSTDSPGASFNLVEYCPIITQIGLSTCLHRCLGRPHISAVLLKEVHHGHKRLFWQLELQWSCRSFSLQAVTTKAALHIADACADARPLSTDKAF